MLPSSFLVFLSAFILITSTVSCEKQYTSLSESPFCNMLCDLLGAGHSICWDLKILPLVEQKLEKEEMQ